MHYSNHSLKTLRFNFFHKRFPFSASTPSSSAAAKKPQDSTFSKFRAKAIERDRAIKERQENEKRQRLEEQENVRKQREKQREIEENRALNLNKSGSWAPESLGGAGGAPGSGTASTHGIGSNAAPSPNNSGGGGGGHHPGVLGSQAGEVPPPSHMPAINDRDALRKLEAEKRRKQANQNPIDMNQQSQIMSMFEDML